MIECQIRNLEAVGLNPADGTNFIEDVVVGKSLWKELVKSVVPLKKRDGMFADNSLKDKEIYLNNTKGQDDISVSFLSVEDIKKKRLQSSSFSSDLKIGTFERVDKSFYNNLKKDKFVVQARLDLHGMVLEKAYQTFLSFINVNFDRGVRNLLVVTGKGNPVFNTGIIKQSFLNWVNSEDVKNKILYVGSAALKDGGAGAFYIFLRRNINL